MAETRRWAILVALATAIWARAARAADAFEIQVYDGTADEAGHAALEAHLNYVASGLTTAAPPELPPHHQLHFTLEPSYGVLPIWEVGAYVLTAASPRWASSTTATWAASSIPRPCARSSTTSTRSPTCWPCGAWS